MTDTTSAIWGLHASGVLDTLLTGAGIKVAVLDTGIDLDHPDFSQRRMNWKSFVSGEAVQDMHGHGTHCAGTVAGPRTPGPAAVPGYGCAPDVDLHIGKVLNNRGFGRDGDIIAGIDWAIGEGCHIISMSLGSPTMRGQRYDDVYEEIASDALANGCLIVAAAGNDSNRSSGRIAPVSKPANCPSILSVGAIDALMQTANFSNGGMNGDGGAVDLAAPGVGVLSAAPGPRFYQTMDGTSMACPHVAGVAALWAEFDPELRGQRLWDVLVENAGKLDGMARDIGHGLIRAPAGGVG
ncbi:S8 family serine peptidase [Aurantimonas sp. A2-1-M11]|uniref:S8 family serine peptidase n=1 Tax=Aurantimonas sp. A2-1-M11 TaxID=3113712 RepID=UPI002F94DD8C